MAINPVLVTVSVTGKRRRRRDLDTVIGGQEGISPELEEKIHEMQVRGTHRDITRDISEEQISLKKTSLIEL